MNKLNQANYPQRSYGNAVCESAPTYGGDCALQVPDGLTSSTKRLQEVVQELNSATWNLRDFFGMNVPECEAGSCPRPSGHKYEIDEMIVSARASLDNVQTILNHLRS